MLTMHHFFKACDVVYTDYTIFLFQKDNLNIHIKNIVVKGYFIKVVWYP